MDMLFILNTDEWKKKKKLELKFGNWEKTAWPTYLHLSLKTVCFVYA